MQRLSILLVSILVLNCKNTPDVKINGDKDTTQLAHNWPAADETTAKEKCIEKLRGQDYSSEEADEICSCMIGKAKKIFASYDDLKNKQMNKEQEKQWKNAGKDCGLQDEEEQ